MNLDVCFHGDAREILPTMPSESVQCVVTSPPYWGLRDYGVDGQIGLEESLADYIDAMVEVFEQVRRLLRPDGTLFLNLGDAYVAQSGNGDSGGTSTLTKPHGRERQVQIAQRASKLDVRRFNLRRKNLMGLPWRVAFALQDAGWTLRQDIIWHKPNPLPESVTDRCTKAHEYVFLMTKAARYAWHHDAIQEPATFGAPNSPESISSPMGQGFTRRARSGNVEWKPAAARGVPESGRGDVAGSVPWEGSTRNPRSVWSIATTPFAGAHFATFPEALVEKCLMAGTAAGDVVLDPFMGSGTVAAVAQRLGRRWVGCELNPAYIAMQRERTRQIGMAL